MRPIQFIVTLIAVTFLVPVLGSGQSIIEYQPGASVEVTVGADICADSFIFNGAFSGGGTQCMASVASTPQAPALMAPADSTQNALLTLTLSWNSAAGASTYELQLSLSPVFIDLILDDSMLTSTSRVVGPLSLGTTYYWRVRARNDVGYGSYSQTRRFSTILTTSVEQTKNGVPTNFMLSQNYPNPFNPSTVIQFALAKRCHVLVTVFDQLGREVTTLVSQDMDAGYYSLRWNANVPSGIYFYRLQAGEFTETKKMILLK